MDFTMKNPPIKNNQQRSYKRSLNLHISLLIVSAVAVLTRAFILLPEGETWQPDRMFKAFLMLAVAALLSVIIELLYSLTEGTSETFREYSRWVDPINSGLLIALLLPTSTPIYVLVLAVFVGVYVGKIVFGGYGYYIFNPALVGVLFVQITFPEIYDGLTSPLIQLKEVIAQGLSLNFDIGNLLIGNYAEVAIGSTSILLLIAVLIYLLVTRVIDYRISGMFLFAMIVMSMIIGYISFGNGALQYTLINVITGLTIFGAVFLVPEAVSSPTSREAKLIYATVVAVMTMLVRTIGSAYEGLVFAILLGNTITPFLNRTVTRSNKKTLLKTCISLVVTIVVVAIVIGFLVQGRIAENFEAVQVLGGIF